MPVSPLLAANTALARPEPSGRSVGTVPACRAAADGEGPEVRELFLTAGWLCRSNPKPVWSQGVAAAVFSERVP